MAARKRSTAKTTTRRTRKAALEEGGAASEGAAGEASPSDTTALPATAPRSYPLTAVGGQPVCVVHVVAELAPFARTGGLGEAVANLAKCQRQAGLDVAIIMPLYRQVHDVVSDFVPVGEPYMVQVGARTEYARLHESASLAARTDIPRVYFIDNEYYFGRDGLYGDANGDYGDNDRRWAYFGLAALTALRQIAKAPVMMHCHDWHTALAPAYLRAYGIGSDFYRQVWTVITVHNAGFQGHFPPSSMGDVGLPPVFYPSNWLR